MSLNLAEVIITVPLSVGLVVGGIWSVSTLFTPTDVHEIGTTIEEWSVSNIVSDVPSTKGYVDYASYRNDVIDEIKVPYELQEALPDMYRARTTWFKIDASKASGSFTICTHKGDNSNPAGNEILSYDSVTGEEIANEAEVCGSSEEAVS